MLRSRAAIFSAGRMRVVDIPGLGSYELVSGQGYGADDYVKSAWAFACMNIRATALAQLPWRLTRDDVVVESHPILEALERFGPESNWNDTIRATEIDLLLKGAAYWLKNGDGLQRLNPNTITVKRSATGIESFIQTINNKETSYKREEVVYFREFHPTDDLGPGTPAIEAAKNAILAEYEAQRYIKAFFENDALPGLLLTTEQDIPQGEMTKLERWWKDKFQGAKKHHKVAFVDKGMKPEVLTSDLRAMALEEVRDQARRDICTAFRVPMVLVGDLDAANFATAHEARLSLTEEVILPRADYFANVINTEYIQTIDPDAVFEFATDELSILQEDKNAKSERLVKLKDAGVISSAFVREELGIPETAAPEEKKAPEPPPIPEPMPTEEEAGQPAVFRSWKRKALRALRVGKSADVPFVTVEVDPDIQASIRANLSEATTPEEVMAVFSNPQPRPVGRKAVVEALSTIVDAVRTEPVITVNVPEQPAPIVNVNVPAPVVTVNVPEQPSPIVNVAAPVVKVTMPDQPAPIVKVNAPKLVGTTEEQRIHRDNRGQIDGTTGKATYEYEDD